MSAVLDQLAALDRSLLLFAQGARHPALDAVMVLLGAPWALVVPLAVFALHPAARRDRAGLATFLAVLVAVGCADGSGHLLKLITARPRPCHTLAGLEALVGCGDSFSFPSNHAANVFAAAAVLAHRAPRWRWAWFAAAAAVAYARVYVGAHYPSDVVAGAALGLAVGCAVVVMWRLRTESRGKRIPLPPGALVQKSSSQDSSPSGRG